MTLRTFSRTVWLEGLLVHATASLGLADHDTLIVMDECYIAPSCRFGIGIGP